MESVTPKHRHYIYRHEIENYFGAFIKSEFSEKYLSGQSQTGYHIYSASFVINPQSYDTAEFLKTLATHGKKRIGTGVMIYTGGSYALDLHNKGSEFLVYKKKNKNDRRKIRQIPKSELDLVMIRPHNHKGYIRNMVEYSIQQFSSKHKREIGEIQWRVQR